MRSATLSLAALEALAYAASAKKVVSFDISKRSPTDFMADRAAALEKRATISANLGNTENLYYVNVSVGTPGQNLELQLDTGSSDVWMIENGISDCAGLTSCTGGAFTPSQSSSFHVTQPGGFNISYVDGTGSSGDYFTDNISIGGVTITNQTMGLANQTTITRGLVGVGYDSNEAVCKSLPCTNKYPSLVDQMVTEGKINSRAYSLWLNDLTQTTGSILFGGIDTSKYTGQLTGLPILPNAGETNVTAFNVAWTGFTITTPNSVENNFVQSDFQTAAILDSGTTTATFPDDLANSLINQFGATYSNVYDSWVAPCYLRTANVTLDFTFGGSGGPTVKVPAAEFLLDISTSGKHHFSFLNGDSACLLGFQPAQGKPILLGDTFLRSAYVVYDLDNNEIAIAQTNFNGGASNVQEIQSGSSGIPDVSSSATQTVSATATFGGDEPGVTQDPTATPSSNNLGNDNTPPLAAYTTASYTGQGSFPGASMGASPHLAPPRLKHEGLVVFGLMTVFAAIGSGAIFL